MKKVLAVVMGLAFIAAACNNNNGLPPENDTTQNTEEQAPAPTFENGNGLPEGQEEQPVAQKIEVAMTAKGFEPANITVKKGTKVAFVNKDTKSRWPASAPHPSHTIYPQFDPKAGVAAGKNWEFTFDRVGDWKYHDHLIPTMFGSVTVTE